MPSEQPNGVADATVVCHRCWRIIEDTPEDPVWDLKWDDEPDTTYPTCDRCLRVYAEDNYDRGQT